MASSLISASPKYNSMELEFIDKNIKNLCTHFKTYYGEQASIRVLKNVVEDVPYAIKFRHPYAADLTLTLQIYADFSLLKSNAIINSKTNKYNAEKISNFSSLLSSLLKSDEQKFKTSENVLVEIFTKVFEFVEDNFISTKSKTSSNSSKKEKSSGKTGPTLSMSASNSLPKQSKPENEDNELLNEKKCSMKTAKEVVHRIQWDNEINKDYIIVGYLDRFLGLKECLFNTFDWGDIVLADLGALAIPEHRIHWFKYKGEKIWDKNTRLDNVFGSTGSNTSFYDVIKRMSDQAYTAIIEEEEKPNRVGRPKPNPATPATNVDFLADPWQSDKKKVDERPNYFVSIPINGTNVKKNISKLAEDLCNLNPEIEDFLVPTPSMHLTLCTLKVEDSDELELTKNVLESLALEEEFIKDKSVEFKFNGLGEFYDKVLFVKCKVERMEKLKTIRETILEKLSNAGVNVAGNYYEFVPHLTVLKISQSSVKMHANKSAQFTVSDMIEKRLLEKYKEFEFGVQILEKIELCKMTNIFNSKTYPVEYTLKFD